MLVQPDKEKDVSCIERLLELHGHNVSTHNNSIFLVEDISEETFKEFSKNLLLFESLNPEGSVTIHLMSGGGDWYAGVAFYDLLTNTTLTTTIVAYGLVASAATIIYIAGDIRLSHRHTSFLIHSGEEFIQCASHTASDVFAEVEHQSATMYEMYGERTKKDSKFWRGKCTTEYYLDSTEAVKLGIAHSLI